MRPKLRLVDEPCDKAKDILRQVFDLYIGYPECFNHDAIWTGLTGVVTDVPVFCPCTGVDHIKSPNVIYLDDDWKRGEGRKITSTAEHTWSLILQLAKLKRMQLSGKTIGIIGYGRIGKQIGKYAKSFGMIVGYADKEEDWKEGLCAYDIITLHVPLNEDTKGMIGKREFDLMKDGALIVNTSRYDIVNRFDLIDALNDKLGGYADDFANEHSLWHSDKVISTPHIGGNCIEAREATDIYIAKKAVEYWRSRTHDKDNS